MKQFDIEAYLAGDLNGQALRQFKKELKNNPAFAQEVALTRQLTEDMETIALRQDVREAVLNSTRPTNGMDFKWMGFLGVFILLAVYFFFFY